MLRRAQIIVSLFLVVILVASPSWAAIAYVSNTEASNTLSSTTVSVSVTVSSGSNRMLVIAAYARRTSGVLPAAISGCTFNTSENFTFVRTDTRNNNMAARTELWYLANPTETTANVVCTYANNGSDRVQSFNVLYLTGVEQVSSVDAHNGANGNGTAPSVSITTVTADAWIVDSGIGDADGFSWTVGSGQTQRSNRNLGSGPNHTASSTVDGKASPGAETMDWSQPGGGDWVLSAVAFKPAGASSSVSRGMLMGVGP